MKCWLDKAFKGYSNALVPLCLSLPTFEVKNAWPLIHLTWCVLYCNVCNVPIVIFAQSVACGTAKDVPVVRSAVFKRRKWIAYDMPSCTVHHLYIDFHCVAGFLWNLTCDIERRRQPVTLPTGSSRWSRDRYLSPYRVLVNTGQGVCRETDARWVTGLLYGYLQTDVSIVVLPPVCVG